MNVGVSVANPNEKQACMETSRQAHPNLRIEERGFKPDWFHDHFQEI
jgi:hypothetical protein